MAEGAVALAALGILSYVLRDMTKALSGVKTSNENVAKKIESSHKTDKELLEFMINLNGSLKQTVKNKQQKATKS